MKREAQDHAAEDKKRKEEIELRNQADALVYSTEKQLKEFDEKLDADTKDRITKAKDRLADASKNNPSDIRAAMDALNELWSEASTKMYQASSEQGAQPGAEQAGSSSQANDGSSNVEDADYTVVDDDKK
jgi:molecular chaperone DnaK